MANRATIPIRGGLNTEMVCLTGFLSIAADASVTAAYTKFNGGAFAAAGTGLYTLTLSDTWKEIISVQLTPLKAAAADTQWEVVEIPGKNGVAAGTVITIRHVKTSDGAAVAPGAVNGVSVTVWVKNSGLTW